MAGLNDYFNHGGAAITPATSAANAAAYIAAVKAVRPNVRIHWIAGLWAGSENWPEGAGPDDTKVRATMTALQAQVNALPNCEFFDIRTPIFTIDSPAKNPTHLTTGVFTQGDGTHPSKNAGQAIITKRVWERTTVGT